MVNVELADKDLYLLRELLIKQIEYGGELCMMKHCIRLFDYFKEIESEENSLNE